MPAFRSPNGFVKRLLKLRVLGVSAEASARTLEPVISGSDTTGTAGASKSGSDSEVTGKLGASVWTEITGIPGVSVSR